jgi:hypothetical protein
MEDSFEAEEAAIAERRMGSTGSEEDTSSDLLADGLDIQHGLNNASQYNPIIDSAYAVSHLSDASTAQSGRADSATSLEEVIPQEKSSSAVNVVEPVCEFGTRIFSFHNGFEIDANSAAQEDSAVNLADTQDVTADTDTDTAWDQDQDQDQDSVWRDSIHPVALSGDQNHESVHDRITAEGARKLSSISSAVCGITRSASDAGAITAEFAQGNSSAVGTFARPESHLDANSALEEELESKVPPLPTISEREISPGCFMDGVDSNGPWAESTNGVRPMSIELVVLQEVEIGGGAEVEVDEEENGAQPVPVEVPQDMDRELEDDPAPVLVVEDARVGNQGGLAPFGLFDFINSMYLALDGVFVGPQPDPPAAIAAFFDFSPVWEHLINFFVFISNMGCLIMVLKLGPAFAVRITLAAFGLEQSFDTACTEFVCFLLLKIRSPVLVLPLTYEFTRWWLQILFLCHWLVGVSVLGFVIVIAGKHCTAHNVAPLDCNRGERITLLHMTINQIRTDLSAENITLSSIFPAHLPHFYL